jgi:TolB protein
MFPLRRIRAAGAALATLAVLLLALPAPASAELQIDVTRGHLRPMPIAIPDFTGSTENENRVGREIAQVVRADLERSGLFAPIDPDAFIEEIDSVNRTPRFGDWRVINAEALVTGSIAVQGDGQLRTEFRLWDVFAETYMTGQRHNGPPNYWRQIAHQISDLIYERLTGEKGYFDSQIVYVSETGPVDKRVKRLAVMDQDGANHRFLTSGDNLVLTPRFSPTSQEVTYMAYVNNQPRVFLLDIFTNRTEVVGDFPGMTFAPRFHPNGDKIIMSLASDGNSEIYTMDLRTRRVERLTNHPDIDTSPSYSPDGTQIVFNSDRGGSQQLYVMNANGSAVRRISFGDGRYATPVWSPRGDLIAFTKADNGQYYIGVMRPDGSGERLLTSGYLVEGPTWAPNGRLLAYYEQTRARDSKGTGYSTRLMSIDLTGQNERELITPVDGSDPAWSPLRQ